MRTRMRYEGKMTDKHPAYVWEVISDYVLDPFDYNKVVDYLKERYGRKKSKIIWANVNKISDDIKFIKSKLKEWNINPPFGTSLYGFYYFDLLTQFEISGHSYSIRQEGLMKVSEVISQVVVRRMTMYDKNGVAVVEVK